MNTKLSSLMDYVSQLLKKYGELQQIQMKNTYRLASIKNSGNGTKVIFQVIGKSTFMECTPAEILSNDSFIERFSKKDIQKITYSHAQDESAKTKKQTEIKLVCQEFNINEGKTKFALKDKEGNTTIKTAQEISKDKKIINHLTQQDALNIGYVAGYENSQNTTIE